MKDSIYSNFKKFFLVGIICFLVDISFYFLFLRFNLGIMLAKPLSFVLGVLTGYFLNTFYTFNQSHMASQKLFRYIILYTVTMFINAFSNKYFLGLLLNTPIQTYAMIFSVIIATGIALFINFFGLRYYVFRI